jgi:hypothetical protein
MLSTVQNSHWAILFGHHDNDLVKSTNTTFLSVRLRYTSQHPVLKSPQFMSFHTSRSQASHSYKTAKSKISAHFNLHNFQFSERAGIFVFATVCRLGLRPTLSPFQEVSGARMAKQSGRESDHQLHLVSRLRICGIISPLPYTSSPRDV